MPEPTVADLESVIGALMSASRQDSAAAYARAAAQPEVARALGELTQGDVDGFYFALVYPFEQVVRGLVDSVVPGSHAAQFLVGHARFVETQFRAVIEKYEGSACCADKTGFLMDSLLEFFKTGREVVLDRTQNYTYHLPSKVFQSHAEVLDFFDAVQRLYYGRSEPFIQALARIDAQAGAGS